MFWRVWSAFRRDRRGSSLVEFTFVAPIVLITGFGAVELGNALYGHHIITTGVRDAARFLARFDNPDAQAATAQTLAATGEVGGTSPRIAWFSAGDVAVTFSTVANPTDPITNEKTYRGPDPIRIVRVTATATYPGLGFLALIGQSPITMTVFHEERVVNE